MPSSIKYAFDSLVIATEKKIKKLYFLDSY